MKKSKNNYFVVYTSYSGTTKTYSYETYEDALLQFFTASHYFADNTFCQRVELLKLLPDQKSYSILDKIEKDKE